jgi:hypothetical protein
LAGVYLTLSGGFAVATGYRAGFAAVGRQKWRPAGLALLAASRSGTGPTVPPGLLGDRDPAQCERHQRRGQGEQYRGQGERRGGGAKQLPAAAAQWLGGAKQPVYSLH